MKVVIICLRLWVLTALTFGAGFLVYSLIGGYLPWWAAFLAILAALAGSFPAFCLLFLALSFTRKQAVSIIRKKIILFFIGAFLCAFYGLAAVLILERGDTDLLSWLLYTGALLACFLSALLLSHTQLNFFFQ